MKCVFREHGHATEALALQCTIRRLEANLKLAGQQLKHYKDKCICGVTAAINVRNGYQESKDEN